MTERSHQIGVIGFGVMGTSMARNLAKRGHTVYGFSRTQSKVSALEQDGIRPATLETIASACTIILLSLNDGASVKQVLFGDSEESSGLAALLSPGSLIIDTTTISPQETLEISERCKALQVSFVDSPVTGGDVGARNATLTCMCGGDAESISRAREILSCIGSKIVHVGPIGSGQTMKAVNQIAVALGIAAMTEALLFAENQGLDPALTLEVLQSGAAGSWALSNYAPRLMQGDTKPGFSATHMLKDLLIALSETEPPMKLVTTEAVTALFQKLVATHPHVGNHALILAYKNQVIAESSG
jgi:3-hydroxyisobutyrate dehydrogenase